MWRLPKMKYARINNGEITEVINTMTEIPQEQWTKKGVLPFIDIKSDTGISGVTIYDDRIENVIVNVPKPEPTLEEYKITKYAQIKEQGKRFILAEYSIEQQTSALAGFYSVEENEEIIAFVKTYFDKIRAAGVVIKAATTKEEIDVVYFKKDIFGEDEMTVIDTIFWGD